MKITLKKELTGSILDIGGGGEGIIGRLYGSRHRQPAGGTGRSAGYLHKALHGRHHPCLCR